MQRAKSDEIGNDFMTKRILLVDDERSIRESLSKILRAENHEIVLAENGQEAIEKHGAERINLLILDLNMPVKNGWDTFERLTREYPLIPVIIVTARPNQLFTALGAGAGALLEKPMDIPTLLRTIEGLLAESAEERLARLAGKKTEFHYKPSKATHEWNCPAKHR